MPELMDFFLNETDGPRVELGAIEGVTVGAPEGEAILLIGPLSARHKTELLPHAVNHWPGPVVVASSSSWLYDRTRDARARHGAVVCLGENQQSGQRSMRDRVTDWPSAQRLAETLMRRTGRQGLEGGEFWMTAGQRLLSPLLFAGSCSTEHDFRDVLRWVEMQDEFEPRAVLQKLDVPDALQAAEASWNREDRSKSSIYTTVEISLEPFLHMNSPEKLDIDDFLAQFSGTLYMYPEDAITPPSSTLASVVVEMITQRAQSRDRQKPILLVLDDVTQSAATPSLSRIAALGSDVGVQVITTCQDLAEIEHSYGGTANAVVDNHAVKLVLPGLTDYATQAFMRGRLPDVEAHTVMDDYSGLSETKAFLLALNLTTTLELPH